MSEYKIKSQTAKINPASIDLEISGKSGIRIRSDGLAMNTTVEIKVDDEWKMLKHIQKVEVVADCNGDNLIRVKLDYLVLP